MYTLLDKWYELVIPQLVLKLLNRTQISRMLLINFRKLINKT